MPAYAPDSGFSTIAQNEWTSLIIHDHRSGKFRCTSALNKLQIREECVFFGPPALVKLIGATSLAPKLQIHWRNIENEEFTCGLSTKDKNFCAAEVLSLSTWKLLKRGHFLYGSWLWVRFSLNLWQILKSTDRMFKISLSLSRIRFNFYNL